VAHRVELLGKRSLALAVQATAAVLPVLSSTRGVGGNAESGDAEQYWLIVVGARENWIVGDTVGLRVGVA